LDRSTLTKNPDLLFVCYLCVSTPLGIFNVLMGNGPNPGLFTTQRRPVVKKHHVNNGPMTKWKLDPDSTLAGFEPATFSFEGGHYNHSSTQPVIIYLLKFKSFKTSLKSFI
jgi:hypothetical protein